MVYSNQYVELFIYIMIILIIAKFIYVVTQVKYRLQEEPLFVFDPSYTFLTKDFSKYKIRWDEGTVVTEEISQPLRLSSQLSRFTQSYEFYTICKDPYKVIGCSIHDPIKVLKIRYRELVKKWHPDAIISMGVTKEEIEQATSI